MKSRAKAIGIICVVGFLASFFFGISFYYRDLPSTPRPDLGRTYPINTHGFPLYLTKQEDREMRLSFALSAMFFLFAMIIYFVFDPFDKRKREAFPKRREPWNRGRAP